MKKLLAILLILGSLPTLADNIEVLLYKELTSQNDRRIAHLRCLDTAYDLETNTIIKTGDSTVSVRKINSRYSDMMEGAYYSCTVLFLSSNKTAFKLKKDLFNFKRCKNKKEEIENSKKVVWASYKNRVKLENGTRGCRVQYIKGEAI